MEGDTGLLLLKDSIFGNFTKPHFHTNTLLGLLRGPQKEPVGVKSPET